MGMIVSGCVDQNGLNYALLNSVGAGVHGRGYGIHTCRHTHISQLLMRHVPLIIVSRRAGHASVATTMNKYGHLISQMSEGVVESHLQEIQQNWV